MPRISTAGVSTGFEPLPHDITVRARLMSFENKKSKAGNDKVTLTYVIVDPEEYTGRRGWEDLSLLPQALWKFKAAALNMQGENELSVDNVPLTDLLDDEDGFDTDDVLRAIKESEVEFYVQVTQHEWQGKTKNDFEVIAEPADTFV